MRNFFARRENNRLHPIAFLAAGSLVGAGAALLLAPRTGRKTRQLLVRMGESAWKGARNFQSALNSRMGHVLGDLQHNVKSCMNDGRMWTKEKRKELDRAFKAGKKHIEKEVAEFCVLG